MAISVSELWILVLKSRLVDRGVLDGLRGEFAKLPGAKKMTAETVAHWLVTKGALSKWQARRLKRGDLGPFFIGDYRLMERLETGHAGLLFQARHEPSGRMIALMTLSRIQCRNVETWTNIVKRTTLAHQISHAIPSRTYALETVEKVKLIICEDIVGNSLEHDLTTGGALDLKKAGTIVSDLTNAVAEMHRLGAVHGGISLSAIKQDSSGNLRLLQFPLSGDPHVIPSRVPLDDPKALEFLNSSVAFIAPELLETGRVCDGPSDVYALGAVLYSLVAGRLPCWTGNVQSSLDCVRKSGPENLGPAVPQAIATLISFMMAREPSARYPSAVEAADAIAACFRLPAPPIGGLSTVPSGMPLSEQSPRQTDAVVQTPSGKQSAVGTATATKGTQSMPKVSLSPTEKAKQRATRLAWIGSGFALAIVILAIVIIWNFSQGSKEVPPVANGKSISDPVIDTVLANSSESNPTPRTEELDGMNPIEKNAAAADDGTSPTVAAEVLVSDKTLPWGSPTHGEIPSLTFLPLGSQLILVCRPADASADEEGERLLRSLGPRIESTLAWIESITGHPRSEIDEILAGWQAGKVDEVLGGYVIRTSSPINPMRCGKAWGVTAPTNIDGDNVYESPSLSYWLPPDQNSSVLVVAPKEQMESILETKSDPPLNRDMETLTHALDADRHLTLFGAPHYLLSDGRSILAGPLIKLQEPLTNFFGDNVQAAAISIHCGESFFIELNAVATIDMPAASLAAMLMKHINELSDIVENYCTSLNPHPYGKKLVLRLPGMIREVDTNARTGAENKVAVVNCYLPRSAGHNLVLASELAIEQTPGIQSVALGAPGLATTPEKKGAMGALQKKISLTFVKDTLEKSVQMISDEIGVEIEIIGPDLQLDGITKNQSFGLAETDKSAEEILRTILRKSNTDGKLVFVIRTKDGVESIDITTRAACAKRKDVLPPGFEAPAADTPEKKKP